MISGTPQRVLLIDDDAGNNKISQIFLKRIMPDTAIVSFTEPETGLHYIQEEYTKAPVPTVLLLDINMPVLSGWEVLDELNKLPRSVTDSITIYILSSSINPADKRRASEAPLVSGYIEKPFTAAVLKELFLSKANN